MDILTTGLSSVIRNIIKMLLKPFVNSIGQLLFKRAYEISTLWHIYKDEYVFEPITLLGCVEYRVHWREYHRV